MRPAPSSRFLACPATARLLSIPLVMATALVMATPSRGDEGPPLPCIRKILAKVYQAQLARREAGVWEPLERAVKIKTASGDIELDHLVGAGASSVFTGPDRKVVVKIMRATDDTLSLYEQTAAEYLRSLGEDVPTISAPERVRVSRLPGPLREAAGRAAPERGVVLVSVREYREGLGNLDMLGLAERSPDWAKEQAKLGPMIDRLRARFTDGGYRRWLTRHNPTALKRISHEFPELVERGDLNPGGFLYSPDHGWQLIDP